MSGIDDWLEASFEERTDFERFHDRIEDQCIDVAEGDDEMFQDFHDDE